MTLRLPLVNATYLVACRELERERGKKKERKKREKAKRREKKRNNFYDDHSFAARYVIGSCPSFTQYTSLKINRPFQVIETAYIAFSFFLQSRQKTRREKEKMKNEKKGNKKGRKIESDCIKPVPDCSNVETSMATLLFGQLRRSLFLPLPKNLSPPTEPLELGNEFFTSRRRNTVCIGMRYARSALKNHTIIQHDCRRRYLFARLLASVHEEARETARIIRTRNTAGSRTGRSEKLITGPPPLPLLTVLSIFYDAPQDGCECLHACTATRGADSLDGEGAREDEG